MLPCACGLWIKGFLLISFLLRLPFMCIGCSHSLACLYKLNTSAHLALFALCSIASVYLTWPLQNTISNSSLRIYEHLNDAPDLDSQPLKTTGWEGWEGNWNKIP